MKHPAPVHAIRDDVPCAACGYNLRGLPPVGKCPECGDSIRASLRLRWMSDPVNRQRHQYGLAMQVIAIALMVLIALPVLTLVSFVVRFEIPPRFYWIILLLVNGTITVALFRGTRPIAGVHRWSLRWPIRAAAALATLILLALNSTDLTYKLIPATEHLDLWNHACSATLAALLMWTIEVMPCVRSLDSSARFAAGGLGVSAMGALGAFLAVSVTIGTEAAGCVTVLLAFVSTSLAATFCWITGRDFWS